MSRAIANKVWGVRPEPNFARLVTEDGLSHIVVSAHALRRFIERVQPDIPGADRVAQAMARLEDIGSGRRSGPEQGQLNRYRDWMAKHAEPVVLDLIRCEGCSARYLGAVSRPVRDDR